MFVPETAVNEDNSTILGEHKIGASGQRTSVKPIPEAHGKQSIPDQALRIRVFATNSGHAVAALYR
jgi:hypothetical protein